MKYFIVIAAIVAAGLWGWIIGSLSPTVVSGDTLAELHRQYNHLHIEEDGSYSGQTMAGLKVSGCIANAECEEEN